jgi:hypothetical protein
VQRCSRLLHLLQVTLAEYLADLMPASFKGNETLAEIEASPVWKDPAHEWVLHNKVQSFARQRLSCSELCSRGGRSHLVTLAS